MQHLAWLGTCTHAKPCRCPFPGTGKTMLARAAAADAGAHLFVINGPDVVSEYYGESEEGLRGIFSAAQRLAPSVRPLWK